VLPLTRSIAPSRLVAGAGLRRLASGTLRTLRALRSHRARSTLARLVGCVLLSAVALAPLSAAWAVSHASVEETVGITPTRFSFSTAGHSELRLGIAGTVYLPMARGPLGVIASVEGPGVPDSSSGDLAAYLRPGMLRLYTGLFHDPAPAIQRYVDRLADELRLQFLLAELVLAISGGALLFLVSVLLSGRPPAVPPGALPRVAGALLLVLVATCGLALLVTGLLPAGRTTSTGPYRLTALDGTAASGSTTNSPVLRLLMSDAVARVQGLVRRQESDRRTYLQVATRQLEAQATSMSGPADGETAVLMQSDMHCNGTMIKLQAQVVSLLRARFGTGVPALMGVTGDLTTNGTAAEGGCITDEAGIAAGAPVAAVLGNHESDVSRSQMEDAGMTVLGGSTQELAGIRVLGDGDPERSELFGATRLRGEETQVAQGDRLHRAAVDNRPDLVLVHEAYAAQSFVGTDSMTAFLGARRSPTRPYDDGVRDLPAAAVLYGHWHRSIEPRVVWNSDGTWTLVMELDTSGGAIDTPSIGHFSTPWSPPQQPASFPVLFLDRDTGLVRGYQLYRFDTDGTVQVQPRVDVGAPASVPTR
jgi:hypothetical protein